MPKPARPTLRCMRDELTEDWQENAHRTAARAGRAVAGLPLHKMTHPAIAHAAELFTGVGDAEAERESISGLTDPMWWKLKTSRWRGAVWEDGETSQAWLCAAGLRREGERSDFYKSFMASVGTKGPDFYLPTDDDRALVRLEDAADQEHRWEVAVHIAVLGAIADASEYGRAAREIPSLPEHSGSLGSLTIEVERLVGEWLPEGAEQVPAGIAVQLLIEDWSDPERLKRAQVVACSALSPREEDWDVAPDALGVRLMATITEARLRQIIVAGHVAVGEGDVALVDVQPVSEAHYAARKSLAEASVVGFAVRGLCGTWFVPRQDHTAMPICGGCDGVYTAMDGTQPG